MEKCYISDSFLLKSNSQCYYYCCTKEFLTSLQNFLQTIDLQRLTSLKSHFNINLRLREIFCSIIPRYMLCRSYVWYF